MLRKRVAVPRRRKKFVRKTKEDRIQNRKISRIQKAITAEYRYVLHAFQDQTLAAGFNINTLSNIVIGDLDGQRSSNQVAVNMIDLRIAGFPQDSPGINDSSLFRVMLVVDTQTNDSNPTDGGVNGIFQNNADINQLVTSPYSFDNYYRSKRYRILYDSTKNTHFDATFTNATPITGSQLPIVQYRFRKVFKKPIIITYSPDTAGPTSNPQKNQIWLVTVNNTINGVDFYGNVMMRYTP